MEIKPESFVRWTLNGKLKLFRPRCFLSIDRPGLIGVRQQRHNDQKLQGFIKAELTRCRSRLPGRNSKQAEQALHIRKKPSYPP